MLARIKKTIFSSDKNNYFLITSHGQTATLWLAITLNNHPDIFCTHSYLYPPVEPLQKMKLQKEGFNFPENINKYFWNLSLNDFFEQHKDVTEKKTIGNVHAFHVGRLIKLLANLEKMKRKRLKIVNLLRHPVDRIQSTYHCWWSKGAKTPDWIDNDFANATKLVSFLKQAYPSLDLSSADNRIFVVAISQAISVYEEAKQADRHGIPNYRHEDITQSPSHYAKLLSFITGEKHSKESNYIKEVFNYEKVNMHNRQRDQDTLAIFQSWERWQKDLFLYVAREYNLINYYKKYGYYLEKLPSE